MKKASKIILDFCRRYAAFLAVVAVYIVFAAGGVGCPIHALTGVSCPGCGMTRAWLAVLRLYLKAAFYYHPLFWTVPVALIVFFFRKKLLPNKTIQTAALSVLLAAFLIVYMLRLLVIKDSAIFLWK